MLSGLLFGPQKRCEAPRSLSSSSDRQTFDNKLYWLFFCASMLQFLGSLFQVEFEVRERMLVLFGLLPNLAFYFRVR